MSHFHQEGSQVCYYTGHPFDDKEDEENWWNNEEEEEDDEKADEWFDRLIRDYDTDGDNTLDEEELKMYWEDKVKPESEWDWYYEDPREEDAQQGESSWSVGPVDITYDSSALKLAAAAVSTSLIVSTIV